MDDDAYFASTPGSAVAPRTPPVPPTSPARQGGTHLPTVLPVDPHLGWARAGLAHRVMAVAAVPLGLAQVALALSISTRPGVPGDAAGRSGNAVLWLAFLSFLVAPPLYYAAARVVRPHLRPGGERASRHLLASTGTALAVPVVTTTVVAVTDPAANADGVFPVLVLLGLPALLLCLVTTVWGLASAATRRVGAASSRR